METIISKISNSKISLTLDYNLVVKHNLLGKLRELNGAKWIADFKSWTFNENVIKRLTSLLEENCIPVRLCNGNPFQSSKDILVTINGETLFNNSTNKTIGKIVAKFNDEEPMDDSAYSIKFSDLSNFVKMVKKHQPFSKVLFTLDAIDLDSLRLKTSQNNDSFVSAYQVKRTPLKDKTMN